ncbi:MAG: hypothetical protein LLF92_05900 [Planctomycetaceae bacterium]|nr:hypothetical protein [Planctomycetaceae bacterium]
MNFYSITKKIDKLKLSDSPQNDWNELRTILESGNEFERYFYTNMQTPEIPYPSSAWAKVLYENRQFEDLNESDKKIQFVQRIKSRYLLWTVSERPYETWEIIKSLNPKDQLIQANFLDAVKQLPADILADCVSTVCNYLNMHQWIVWVWLGEPAANIMLRLAKLGKVDDALKIAKILLEVVELKDDKSSYTREHSRIEKHDYIEILKTFREVWQVAPKQSLILMFDILEQYLKSRQQEQSNDYSTSINYSLDDLDGSIRQYKDSPVIFLIKSICEALKYLCEKRQVDIQDIMNYLEQHKVVIYRRFKLYLLRYYKGTEYTEEIKTIISDEKYFTERNFKFEYAYLLRDKYDELKNTPEVFNHFLDWVNTYNLDKDEISNIDEWLKKEKSELKLEEEIEKIKNSRKARKLYIVKDLPAFQKSYNDFFTKSGTTEDNVKPRPIIEFGEVRDVAEDENSPKTANELSNMSVQEVLLYLQDEKNYSDIKKTKGHLWQTPKEGLRGAFQKVVKAKRMEYLHADLNELFKIPSDFLRSYFNALRDNTGIPENEVFDWQQFFTLAENSFKKLPSAKELHDDTYEIYLAIANIIGQAWQIKTTMEFNSENINRLLSIIAFLVKSWDCAGESDSDLVQISCNRVTGVAFEALIDFAVFLKGKTKPLKAEADNINRIDYNYDLMYLPRYIELCDYLLETSEPFRLSVFGNRMTQLFYSNEKWFKKNIDLLINEKNWQIIWYTYLKWARPYIPLYKFLVKKGIYEKAILQQNEDDVNVSKDSEKVSEFLGKHIVIAYFNGWGFKAKQLLNLYYDNASLIAKNSSNSFFKTGFENATNVNKQKAEEHWRYRNNWFKKNLDHPDRIEEAIGLTNWVKKSPLDAKKTLSLLLGTLNFTDGKVCKDDSFGVPEFIIQAICEKADGNELLALKCLLKFSYDPRLGMYSTTWDGKFVEFANKINLLPADCSERKKIWKLMLQLLDNYGRIGIYQTKPMYFNLLEFFNR